MRTIRFRDDQGRVHLGILNEDAVYSVTQRVPSWTDPVQMWYALHALGVTPAVAAERLCVGQPWSYAELEALGRLLPPVAAPEVWAAGVTYERSLEARNVETQIKDSVYDKVYTAERPELFFKATYDRVVAPGGQMRVRSDSHWMVPEPELSLVVSAAGDLVGWTIGNDLSSRDIEGENPLYLPQAKVFHGSCSFGPVLLWNTGNEQPSTWTITLTIVRDGSAVYHGSVPFAKFRRTFNELIAYLLRDNPIQDGTVLMTGTGIVPPDDFTLAPGDLMEIAVEQIGTLRNRIAEQ
ncbi:MAG: fumarylacetoacetate hydrolase family protein [Alicyclobacillus sp.]|nr:fumarylacetoacetate hydrolase family protein [Alicyclobacillus sp.]